MADQATLHEDISHQDEKTTPVVQAQLIVDAPLSEDDLLHYQIDPDEEKKLVRKLDSLIAPIVMVLYLVAFLDRSNIGNAYTAGLGRDLKDFPANGLSVATSLFYVTYVTLETPMATLLKTLRPSRLIPGVTIAWGATVLGSGFMRTYGELLATRLILGACEAALSPCMFLWLTTWYKRQEIATRQCYLFISSAISGVVGGLIASGLIKMDGLQGLRGWQWLYIVEGAITIVIGLVALGVMPDNHETAWILNDREKFLMRVRDVQSREYMGDMAWSWVEVKKALVEPIVWISGFCQLGFDVCLYGFSTFLVVIIQQFGYGVIESQLLTAPVYFWAAVVYLSGAMYSDHKSVRYWLLLPTGLLACVGYAILTAWRGGVGPSLLACFFCGTGIYICVGLHITMISLNMAGYRKRSTAIGINQTVGNIGGVIAGQIYQSTDKPYYRTGHATSLGFMIFALILLTIEVRIYVVRNRAKEGMSEAGKIEMDNQGVKGDHHWSFKYEW